MGVGGWGGRRAGGAVGGRGEEDDDEEDHGQGTAGERGPGAVEGREGGPPGRDVGEGGGEERRRGGLLGLEVLVVGQLAVVIVVGRQGLICAAALHLQRRRERHSAAMGEERREGV